MTLRMRMRGERNEIHVGYEIVGSGECQFSHNWARAIFTTILSKVLKLRLGEIANRTVQHVTIRLGRETEAMSGYSWIVQTWK